MKKQVIPDLEFNTLNTKARLNRGPACVHRSVLDNPWKQEPYYLLNTNKIDLSRYVNQILVELLPQEEVLIRCLYGIGIWPHTPYEATCRLRRLGYREPVKKLISSSMRKIRKSMKLQDYQ